MILTKTLFFSVILFFLSNKNIYLKQIFASPSKKFNSVKKISLCKKIRSGKQTHSVKD